MFLLHYIHLLKRIVGAKQDPLGIEMYGFLCVFERFQRIHSSKYVIYSCWNECTYFLVPTTKNLLISTIFRNSAKSLMKIMGHFSATCKCNFLPTCSDNFSLHDDTWHILLCSMYLISRTYEYFKTSSIA